MSERDSGSLSGKVAIVTGGAKGIGRAIAQAFAEEGANVAVVGRDKAALAGVREAVIEQGRCACTLEADITDLALIPTHFDRISEELGEVDILVNNAGQQHTAPADVLTEAQWDATMDVNLKALFFWAQEAGRRFLARGSGGRIINVGSTYGVVAYPEFSAYCASKGGVIQLTRALAVEWARHGINVNAIGPTAVYTDMMREMLDDQAFRDSYLPRLPNREFPQPEDVAAAALFLAGPGSRFIHGHHLMVDGGYTVV